MKQHFFQAVFSSRVVIVMIAALGISRLQAIDIAPMTWATHPVTNPVTHQIIQEPNRSDWINVLDYGADPTGAIDSAPGIQAALDVVNNKGSTLIGRTVYFPAGIYTIKSTLHLTANAYNLIGCGLNTTIKWAGLPGGAMLWQDGAGQNCRFVGFVWDGGGTGPGNNVGASCAYEEYSSTGSYMTGIRHENESFRNFYATGTYLTDGNYPGGFPAAAIISGFNSLPQPVGEVTIFNCCFKNCATAIHNAVDIVNSFMWVIDGCEFENNGVGFNGGSGSYYVLMNSHFQNSSIADMIGTAGGIQGQRLTSSGSSQFYVGATDGAAFSDCWVDSWTNPRGALEDDVEGQASIVDCTFTHPPVGAAGAICTVGGTGQQIDLLLSNNVAPAFPPGLGMINALAGTVPTIDWVPAGSMSGNVTSSTETFLQSATIADSANVLDVTQSPYNAMPGDGIISPNPGLNNDCTAAIQAAINAAKTVSGSLVYIPGGIYKITSSLTASGGNYTIEGEGLTSELCWAGGSNGTIIAVSSPQNITVRQLWLGAPDNLPGEGYYLSQFPTTDCTTVTGLKETSTGSSYVIYDNLIYGAFRFNNPWAFESDAGGLGLALSGLPAGSTVYIPMLSSPLTVTDCGPAQIYSKMAYIGGVNIAGATHSKTGFLGLGVAEGGQNGQDSPSAYNFIVNDNQNLLVGPYYSEEEANDVELLRGVGTTPGRVAIDGFKTTSYASNVAINVNNYAGRLFYGGAYINDQSTVQIEQTGANAIDLMLADDFFAGSAPSPILGSGANLIATLNGDSAGFMADTPHPLTAANYASLASALDDFRQLGALNLAVEYGPGNPLQVNPSGLVAYWKLDESVNPSADSSMSGMTGTWTNSPTFSATSPSTIPYADPGSISLNGTNQYISMGNPVGLPSGAQPRTICGWAKSTSTAAGVRVIASFGSATTGGAMYIGMNGTSLVGGGDNSDLTVTNFWDTNWHFIVLTYDGATADLYADGQLKATSAESWSLVHSACKIGAFVNTTDFWKGNVDDVRIYNYALSAAQVSSLIQSSIPTLSKAVNVQFTYGNNFRGSAGQTLNGNAWAPSIAPLPYTGTTWTQLNGVTTNLPYSDGTPSTVGYSLTGALGEATNGTSPLTMFTQCYYATSMTLTITGLQNGQLYDLYLPVAFNGNGGNVTVGSQHQSTTGIASGLSFTSGVNYLKFAGVYPTSGSIVVTVTPNGGTQDLGILNGFQITAEANQIVNVQFTTGSGSSGSVGQALNGNAWSSAVSPLPYPGTTWTQLGGATTNLPCSDGTPSTVGYTLSGVSGQANNGSSPLTMFTQAYYAGGTMTLTITGLQNSRVYDVYLPVAFNGNGGIVTVGSQHQSTTGNAGGSSFASGVNYVEFAGITPTSGSIVVTVAPNGGSQGLGILNGFQITKEVP